jgi:hypothetical protein
VLAGKVKMYRSIFFFSQGEINKGGKLSTKLFCFIIVIDQKQLVNPHQYLMNKKLCTFPSNFQTVNKYVENRDFVYLYRNG